MYIVYALFTVWKRRRIYAYTEGFVARELVPFGL